MIDIGMCSGCGSDRMLNNFCFYSTDDSDLKMRVDYNDDLDGSSKLQSGKS